MNSIIQETVLSTKDPVSTPLSRDDFDSGPVSLDEIEPGLWLGQIYNKYECSILKYNF